MKTIALRELVAALEGIAPTRFAESWDNVGLLVGDLDQPITRAMLTIDCTLPVVQEAEQTKSEVIVCYHPPIFQGPKRIVPPHPVYSAMRAGMSLYSVHTALDVAKGGTNDVLADVLDLKERAPLRLVAPRDTHFKLVVFVPQAALDGVSAAVFAAGAGHIGDYSSCSFRSAGTGTFFGEMGTSPVVGQSGRLEQVEEVRFETVVPIHSVDRVIAALRQAHPYEEPAFDLVRLAAPSLGVGLGRIGRIAPVPRRDLIARLKLGLGLSHVLVAGPLEGNAERVAVCAGAIGDLMDAALAAKADVIVAGEVRHHDALRAAAQGVTVVATLHSNSERMALPVLAKQLIAELGIAVVQSQRDRDVFVIHS